MSNSAFATQSATTSTPAAQSVNTSAMSNNFGGFFRNKLINGNFDIWQRATSFSTPSNAAYTADRWKVNYDGTIGTFSVSRQAFTVGQIAVPYEPAYFLRWDHTSAGSASTIRNVEQRVEDVRTGAGQQLTLTFWAKADTTRTVTITPAQNFGGGGSAEVPITPDSGASCALTASFQKFTCVFTCPSITGKTIGTASSLRITFALPINTTMTIDIAQAQLESGSASTAFDIRPLSLEYQLAHRYYQLTTITVPVLAGPVPIPFKTTMRTTPTIAGGGAGYTSNAGLSADGGSASQTAAADQTLTLSAEI